MIAVWWWNPEEDWTRRRACAGPRISVGSGADNDIILDGPGILPQHLSLQRDGDNIYLALPNTKVRLLGRNEQFPVGKSWLLWARPLPNLEAVGVARFKAGSDERRHLDARHPGADEVYADWLEERGESARAEFLRQQRNPVDASRLEALADEVDASWRMLAARPRIEACATEFAFRCPKTWDSLARTKRPEIRHCSECDKDVHYSLTVVEARAHAAQGRCVALDITTARWPDDLSSSFDERTCPACSADAGSAYPAPSCPRCNARLDRLIMMGRMA
jgi:hypothetical protein